jgi:succinoglycan biosynthesis protein ExoV
MPHYSTLDDGNWEQICGLAGLTFLSPFDDSENTVQRIRGARLIIADAMHAAIVADALRVPWIPVALSPESNTFKWLDWTQSLGLPYKPVYLGASTVFEAIGNFSYWFRGIRHYSANRDIAHAIRKFRRDQHRRSRNSWRRWSHAMFLLTYRLPKRVLALKPLQAIRVQWDRLLTRHAVRALEEAAKLPANLSDDSVFDAKLRRFEKLIEEVRERGLRTTV